MKITILGCGTSQGVPRIGGKLNNGWGNCNPNDTKNHRRRASVMFEHGDTRLVVDTGPDFRVQALSAGFSELDAVLYTHDHADHTHGIDDLRAIAQNMKSEVPIYSNKHTIRVLEERFNYIFKNKPGYNAICSSNIIGLNPFTIGNFKNIQAIELIHGNIFSYGFRFDDICYCTDFNDIPKESYQHLYNLDLWIVDCLREDPHPTHSHLEQTLLYIEEFKPKRAILTHMTAELDYETLKKHLPNGVEPAYDGMILNYQG
jgi:phosphoribosyl 1,2-cyclic phosphate phosphodiesterase